MSRPLPPLGWFRAFESAAQLLSFTAAANELGMTQSAVSQQIRSLESRLGCQLFIRKHRGLALTDEGRKLLPEVTRSIDAIRSATAPYDRQTNADVITVATSVSVAQWYLAPALHTFVTRHPGIKIRLLTSVWPDELADASDVQIRFGSAKDNELKYHALGSDQLVIVASPTLLGGTKAALLTDEQLKEHSLIQAVGTTDTWPNRAQAFGLKDSHEATLQVDSHGLAVDLAIAGAGIALTSKFIATPAINNGQLVLANPNSVEARDCYFIAINSQQHAATSSAFVDWILELTQS